MSKPMTLSEKLNRWADAADDECRVDEADLFREADAALAAKDTELSKLREALTPFADAAENLEDDHKDSSPIWEAPAAMSIDAKHLRAARAALKGNEQ